MEERIKQIFQQFVYQGRLVTIEPYGGGHINDTYKVTCLEQDEPIVYILQRINHHVFKRPAEVLDNMSMVLAHIADKIEGQSTNQKRLYLLSTRTGDNYYIEQEVNYWRVMPFIGGTVAYDYTTDSEIIYQVGRAFGKFQQQLSDFPINQLAETIPDFHDTAKRYQRFLDVLAGATGSRRNEAQCEEVIQFALDHNYLVNQVVDGLAQGEIPLRVTHNDTKMNNVLLDEVTHEGVCVIDLDTVMPGSLLYDFGDSIRSLGATAIEDEANLDKVWLDLERFESYSRGFLEEVRSDLTEREKELLPIAGILITFENGLRFLTDYLEDDIYYKVSYPTHNLVRARNQFKFVADMIKHQSRLEEVITDLLKA